MFKINMDLQNIYLKHLASEFGQHGSTLHGAVMRPYDPWWWPVDPANTSELWGLKPEHEQQFLSLCTVPRGKSANLYSGFGGSLSAQRGSVFVVGERPSFNRSYANAVTYLHRLLPRPQAGTRSLHFTDVIKFRGKRLNDHLTKRMIEISTRCLVDEVELLDPSGVLITDMALDGLKAMAQSWNLASVRLAPLIQDSRLKVVPHWKKHGATAAWTEALGDLTQ